MKKFLATAVALAAITATFTGCSDSTASDSSVTSSATTEAGNSTADSTATYDSSAADDETPAAERTAADLAEAVNGCLEWPAMEEVTDTEIIQSFFGIDASTLEDYYFSNALMSVHLNQIIIAKPKAGNEDELKTILDNHFAYIKDGAAFYPDQEISAAGAVQGVTSDGYYYIIVHQIGSEIADVMEAYKPGDEIPQLEVPQEDFGDDGVYVVPTDELGDPYFGGSVEIDVPAADPAADADGVVLG